MDLNLTIRTRPCECAVLLKDDTAYLPEDSTAIVKNNFKFSETVAVDVLIHHKLDGDRYISAVITSRNHECVSRIPIEFDGWFTIEHIVIPSAEWVLKNKDSHVINLYDIVYFSNGERIYKMVDGLIYKSSIMELLKSKIKNTTIYKLSKEYVSICFLKKCYLNLCNLILGQHINTKCSNNKSADSELIYKRDLAWMALNVIKYLTECPTQLAEVERIIELLLGCNGICPKTMASNSGCGCGSNFKNNGFTQVIIDNDTTDSHIQHTPFTAEEVLEIFGAADQESDTSVVLAEKHVPFTESELRLILE